MSVEIQNQIVSLAYCRTRNPIQRAYWQYMNGVPVEDLEISTNQKEAIKKYTQASTCGKSIYQIAQEIGVNSLICSDLHRTKKQYKRAYLLTVGKYKKTAAPKFSESEITDNELINFLKIKKVPISASTCAKGLSMPVHSVYYKLKRLEKKGKVKSQKESSFVTWVAVTE